MTVASAVAGSMPLTLIRNAEVYCPDYVGRPGVLIAGGSILAIGSPAEMSAIRSVGPVREMDATGLLMTPGFIDPHQHIIGAGGESGFHSRVNEAELKDSASFGITTVVGLLGTDTSTRHLTCLMAKARQLDEEGLTACIYTGGYGAPPLTFTGSVTGDLVVIDNVIGVGEIAISDFRSSHPTVRELAKLVSETGIGGTLSGKSGVTHFHVGAGRERLSPLRELLDNFPVEPTFIYPTHINRNEDLLKEAVDLAHRGSYVDMDTTDGKTRHWIERYRDLGGPMEKLTVSTDSYSSMGNPEDLYHAFAGIARAGILGLPALLRLFSSNAASCLKLTKKGRVTAGSDADLLLLDSRSFELVHTFSKGKPMVVGGRFAPEPSGSAYHDSVTRDENLDIRQAVGANA